MDNYFTWFYHNALSPKCSVIHADRVTKMQQQLMHDYAPKIALTLTAWKIWLQCISCSQVKSAAILSGKTQICLDAVADDVGYVLCVGEKCHLVQQFRL